MTTIPSLVKLSSLIAQPRLLSQKQEILVSRLADKTVDISVGFAYTVYMMKNKFLFYKELYDGTYIVETNLSKTKAERLYKEALKSFGVDIKATGWEQVLEPLSLSQQIKFKKGGLSA